MPEPREGETQDKFISRCMSSDEMQKDYPEQDRRVAVCFSKWRKKHGGKPPKK